MGIKSKEGVWKNVGDLANVIVYANGTNAYYFTNDGDLIDLKDVDHIKIYNEDYRKVSLKENIHYTFKLNPYMFFDHLDRNIFIYDDTVSIYNALKEAITYVFEYSDIHTYDEFRRAVQKRLIQKEVI